MTDGLQARRSIDGEDAAAGLALLKGEIEARLADLVPPPEREPTRLHAAIRHALLGESKRIRPIMTLLVSGADAATRSDALDAGCAVEMVHTASLIFDDLPAMDDAAMRRRRPTTHKAFGEGTAILAAVALLNRAFEVLAGLQDTDPALRARLARILAGAIGSDGLVAGQEIDLNGRDALRSAAAIEHLNWLKTGVLFVAAAEMGAVLRGLDDDATASVRAFARHLGLAFQTMDDLLDGSGTPEMLGKDVKRDIGKPTLVALHGRDGAWRASERNVTQALEALNRSSLDPAPFEALAKMLLGQLVPADRQTATLDVQN